MGNTAVVLGWLDEWQKRLRLQDWRITFEWFPLSDAGDSLGNCSWNAGRKMALIKLRRPDCIGDGPESNRDLESTLVHELLHLQFLHVTPAQDDGPLFEIFESAIDLTAEALVAAKRYQAEDIKKGAA